MYKVHLSREFLLSVCFCFGKNVLQWNVWFTKKFHINSAIIAQSAKKVLHRDYQWQITSSIIILWTPFNRLDTFTFNVFHVSDSVHVTISPKKQKVLDKGVVTFQCKLSTNSSSRIYWRVNGRRITANTRRRVILDTSDSSVLRIAPVHYNSDGGTYECLSENGPGANEVKAAKATLDIYESDNPS